MKRTLVAIALAAAIPAAVFAASETGGPRHRGPNVERMAEQLDLSTEQQEKLRALFETHEAERKATREKMRASMKEVLTPEQQARMKDLREERRERRKERGKGRRHGRDCERAEGAEKS